MNFSYSNCQKIGEINRFNQKKEFSCAHYLNSEHQRKFNPGFNINDFCKYCKDHIKNEELKNYQNRWCFDADKYRAELKQLDKSMLKMVLEDKEMAVKFLQTKLKIVKEVFNEKE